MSSVYCCLEKQQFSDALNFSLVSIRKEDIECIRLWRNAQMEALRQKLPIEKQEQIDYFDSAIAPTFLQPKPPQILFSFLSNETLIGYGGLTNISWDNWRTEISFLLSSELSNDLKYSEYFTRFLALLVPIAFTELNLHRIFTETYVYRQEHIKTLEAFGFILEGTLRDNDFNQGKFRNSLMHSLLSTDWRYGK